MDKINRVRNQNMKEVANTLFTFIKFANFPVTIIDCNGIYYFCNKKAAEIMGKSMNEIIGHNYRSFHTPKEIEDITILIERLKHSKEIFQFKKSYNEKTLIVSFYPILNKEGNVEKIVTTSRDITEYQRIEKKLRNTKVDLKKLNIELEQKIEKRITSLKISEEKFRILFENLVVNIVIFDYNGVFQLINKKAAEYLGSTSKSIIGKSLCDVLPKKAAERYLKRIQRVYDSNIGVISEDTLEMSWGKRTFLINEQPLRNQNNVITGVISASIDISDRKNSELKLKESERRFKQMAEISLLGITIVQDNKIMFINQKSRDILEIPHLKLEAPYDEIVRDMLAIEDQKRFLEYISKRQKEETDAPNFYSTKIYSYSGHLKYVEVCAQSISYYNKPADFISFIDITKLKKYEKELEELNINLEQKVEARTKELKETQQKLIRKEKLATIGKLSGGIAHELRNPLGVISNSIYFLNMKINNKEVKVIKHLNIIKHELNICNQIISDLLNFTKTKSPNFSKVNINSAINDLINNMEIPKNIDIEKKFALEIPDLFVDQRQIQQAFQNLILNAFQAMPLGGILEIKTYKEENMVNISFKDTGEGILNKNLKKIFEPLFTTKAKGFGLGLSIVKDIITSHNGTIDVESKIDTGSTFIIKLPILKSEDA